MTEQPDSSETTQVLPIAQVEEQLQIGASLAQAHPNEATGELIVQGNEPIIEGGPLPQEEKPQPHEITDSSGENFHKAKSG